MGIATNVLADAVVDPLVVIKFGTERAHCAVAVRVDHAGAVKLRLEDWAEGVSIKPWGRDASERDRCVRPAKSVRASKRACFCPYRR